MATLMFIFLVLCQFSLVLAGDTMKVPFAHVCTYTDGTGRPTQANSTFVFGAQGIVASSDLAVDNIFDSNFFNRSCYHSAIGDFTPIWVVDLGTTRQIKSVFVLNMETNPERLRNVTIRIHNVDPIANPSAPVVVCGTIDGGIPASGNITVNCPATFEKIFHSYSKATYPSGRYVSISKDGEYLHFCEVVVNVVGKKMYLDLSAAH